MYSTRVNLTSAARNTTYIASCNGFYEIWGPFVYVHCGATVGSTATPANTTLDIFIAGTFPPAIAGNWGSDDTMGFSALSSNRPVYPYITNEGKLRISGNAISLAANTSIVFEGIYRRQI